MTDNARVIESNWPVE